MSFSPSMEIWTILWGFRSQGKFKLFPYLFSSIHWDDSNDIGQPWAWSMWNIKYKSLDTLKNIIYQTKELRVYYIPLRDVDINCPPGV